MVLPRMNKFDMVTLVGDSMLLRGQPHSPSQGVGPTVSKIFWYLTYAHTVWPRANKFSTVTHMEERVSHTLIPSGPTKRLGPPTCSHSARETATTLCMVIKLDVGKIFTWSTTLPTLAKRFGARMLTRDLFAVDNLLALFVHQCRRAAV